MVGFVTAFAAGIWTMSDADLSWPYMLGLAGFLLLALTYGFDRHRNRQHRVWLSAVLVFLWLLAGMMRMGVVGAPTPGGVRDYEGQEITIHGTISGVPKVSTSVSGEWHIRYEIVLDSVTEAENKRLPSKLAGGALLNVRQYGPQPEGEEGDSISASGTVRLFHAYHNPGQPDWAAVLATRGIDARISAVPGTVRIVRREGHETLLSTLARWRSQVRAALMQAMPDKDANLIMGMLFGGYDGIDRETVRDFATTGIVHILSVSGAHIALVAGAIFWLSRRLAVQDRWAAGLAAAAMVGYGFLSGFSAPVVRSVIMGLIGMAAIGSGRLASAPRALSLATLGMLIYEPRNLFDISFQLSIGCTAGLLFLHPRLSTWMHGCIPNQAGQWVVEGVAATLAAQLAVIPFLSWYFGNFPIISLCANLLVVPILEAVILLGLLGILLAGAFAPLAHAVFIVISLLTGLAVEINRFLARIPGGSITLPAMGIGSGCLYYGVLLGCACYDKHWLHWRSRQTAVILLIVVGTAIWGVTRPGPLQVHFIDVGQGDATLIITPHGETILVDAGGATGPQNGFDIGERVVVPYLRHYGVKSIDWLILTHNHQDHAGGAAAVAEILGVRQVLLRQEEAHPPAAILRLQQAMHGKGMREAAEVSEIKVDGVTIKLFQAGDDDPDRDAKGKKGSSLSENGRSNVPRIEYGRHSFLLTGDLEGEGEKKLCEKPMPPSTVLKVGHHGARKSTQSEFLARITPEYAVISVGADNHFGHPTPETVHRLQEWPVTLYRTDHDGAVVFHSDGETLTVEKTVH